MSEQKHNKRRCHECRFFKPKSGRFHCEPGLCQRYPPQASSGRCGQWPVVDDTDWCGEFQPIKSTKCDVCQSDASDLCPDEDGRDWCHSCIERWEAEHKKHWADGTSIIQ